MLAIGLEDENVSIFSPSPHTVLVQNHSQDPRKTGDPGKMELAFLMGERERWSELYEVVYAYTLSWNGQIYPKLNRPRRGTERIV